MADALYAKVPFAHHDEIGYNGGALGTQHSSTRKASRKVYKPLILRTASLLALLVVTVLLIGLLQYALIRLPNVHTRFTLDTLRNATASVESMADHATSALMRRQTSEGLFVTTEPSTTMPDTGTPMPTLTPSRPSSDYVPVEITTTLPPVSTETDIASSAPSSDYVATETTEHVLWPSEYVAEETTIIASSPASSEYVAEETIIPVPTTTPGAYVPVKTTDAGSTTSIAEIATPSTSNGNAAPGVNASGQAANETDQDSNSPGQQSKEVVITLWSSKDVFVGTYLAVLLAVIYRVLISTLDTQLRLIDPFRQLYSSDGALASTAFFTSYHSSETFGPIFALLRGRYMLFFVGIAFWTSSLLPALATEAVFVDTKWDCPDPEVRRLNACPPRTTATVLIVRLLQGILGFAAIVLVALVFMLRTPSGLERDPSSIAAVATLMGHPVLENDLSKLPSGPGVTVKLMRREIEHRRYKLDDWHGESGEHHRGIIPVDLVNHGYAEATTYHSSQSAALVSPDTAEQYQHFDLQSSAYEEDMAPRRWRWDGFLLLFMVVGTFGVVLAYYRVGGNGGFNTWFSSNTFGPRFILTGSATIIAIIWGGVEQRSMVMAPFHRLSRTSASFDTLSFAPTITPILSTWRAMTNGFFFAGTVTLMTLLAEALSIAISPFSTGQTHMTFLVVSYISMAILGVMTLVTLFLFLHGRHEPKLPVMPDTLGAKMSYLAGTRTLANFNGNSGVYGENRLRSGRYAFKTVSGRDGRRCWKVDQLGHEGEHY